MPIMPLQHDIQKPNNMEGILMPTPLEILLDPISLGILAL